MGISDKGTGEKEFIATFALRFVRRVRLKAEDIADAYVQALRSEPPLPNLNRLHWDLNSIEAIHEEGEEGDGKTTIIINEEAAD